MLIANRMFIRLAILQAWLMLIPCTHVFKRLLLLVDHCPQPPRISCACKQFLLPWAPNWACQYKKFQQEVGHCRPRGLSHPYPPKICCSLKDEKSERGASQFYPEMTGDCSEFNTGRRSALENVAGCGPFGYQVAVLMLRDAMRYAYQAMPPVEKC